MSLKYGGIENSHNYLYKLIEVVEIVEASSLYWENNNEHILLYIKHGRGRLLFHNDNVHVQLNQLYYIAPHISYKWEWETEDPVSYVKIHFNCYSVNDSDVEQYSLPLLTQNRISTYSVSKSDNLDTLLKYHHSKNTCENMKASIIFQELLLNIWKSLTLENKELTDQGVESSRLYIEQCYANEITREQLAAIAGLHPDYYSKVFKKKYGKSPNEYLNYVRINHAKQSLLKSNDSLRTIAQEVGFKDEFYFSRKFKSGTGMSPSFYINKIKFSDKIVSFNHLITGHMVSLDTEPYAAIMNNIYPIENRLHNTVTIGQNSPDIERLIELKPELIIMRENINRKNILMEQLYTQIAPTIVLPYYDDWHNHLQTVAKSLCKTTIANEWMDKYEDKAEKVRLKYASRMEGKTVLIVGIGQGRMCIYGKRNIGAVLYDDLQFAIPKGVERIVHYQEVSLREIKQYSADHIMLTNYQHNGSDWMNHLISDEIKWLEKQVDWKEMKAVRNGAVHNLYEHQHLYTCYTSLSHELLLEKIDALLMSYFS